MVDVSEVASLHHEKLIKAYRLFYGGYEHRAPYYDNYMRGKNPDDWSTPKVSLEEVSKLFRFIRTQALGLMHGANGQRRMRSVDLNPFGSKSPRARFLANHSSR